MIYTVTFNPSLDYVVKIKDFTVGAINRTTEEKIYPGGKGINVSLVLQNLGVTSKVLGFVAGFSGNEIKRLLDLAGCQYDFIEISQGYTRINMKIANKPETAVNGLGPEISSASLQQLMDKLTRLQDNDILVLAGSIPKALPNDIYERILGLVENKNVHTVVDATGDLLLNVLKYKPFLIKPNHEELGEFFGLAPLYEEEQIIKYAQKLQLMGARNVLVSRGKYGAVLVDELGKVHCSKSPEGELVNSVGAGDSMVAGFLAGYLQSKDYTYALQLGLCAGSASAFQEWLASKEDIFKLLTLLKNNKNK